MHQRLPESSPIVLLHGNANPALARAISQELWNLHGLHIPISERTLAKFPDGEINFRLQHSVRGRDAYVIQPTCPPQGNEYLMELFIMLETLHRASASRITAIIPYFGYSRQERKVSGREPIAAKMVANLLEATGVNRVVCIDLHSPAIQGFFEIGMDHLSAIDALIEFMRPTITKDMVIVSPDTGGVKRADAFARALELPLAILHKRRATADSVAIRAVVGDVKGMRPILIDDVISTGNTIYEATEALRAAGALPDVSVVATHAVLAADALQKLRHPDIKRILVTDTIPLSEQVYAELPTIEVVSLAPLLANAIYNLNNNLSLSQLFINKRLPPV